MIYVIEWLHPILFINTSCCDSPQLGWFNNNITSISAKYPRRVADENETMWGRLEMRLHVSDAGNTGYNAIYLNTLIYTNIGAFGGGLDTIVLQFLLG